MHLIDIAWCYMIHDFKLCKLPISQNLADIVLPWKTDIGWALRNVSGLYILLAVGGFMIYCTAAPHCYVCVCV